MLTIVCFLHSLARGQNQVHTYFMLAKLHGHACSHVFLSLFQALLSKQICLYQCQSTAVKALLMSKHCCHSKLLRKLPMSKHCYQSYQCQSTAIKATNVSKHCCPKHCCQSTAAVKALLCCQSKLLRKTSCWCVLMDNSIILPVLYRMFTLQA